MPEDVQDILLRMAGNTEICAGDPYPAGAGVGGKTKYSKAWQVELATSVQSI